jgi:hypothetical protein
MPLLALVGLWVILSLVLAPMIGALFMPRSRGDRDGRVKELRTRGKEPPGPGGPG